VAYDARALQILIASPGDVNEEREIIAEVIYEWNYVNSREKSVVLLPLRWETHTFPEMGTAPQASINRQIVDSCDMAVGVFWTRLGTPTSVAESGTAEEITRVADAGKPVMLYFSRGKADLQSVDLKEYARLTAFKNALYPKALVENYSSPNEFRETFRRQLALRIRDIIADDSTQQKHGEVDSESVVLGIVERNPPQPLASSSTLKLARVICIDKDEIPDYADDDARAFTSTVLTSTAALSVSNENYYRDMVGYFCEENTRRQLWLAVSSSSEQGVRDIHLEIRARSSNQNISLNPPELQVPGSSNFLQTSIFNLQYGATHVIADQGKVTVEAATSKNEWRMEADIPIVQAQRTVLSSSSFLLKATGDDVVTFDATVYSSDALPFSLNSELEIVFEPYEMSYRDILRRLIPGYSETIDERASTESGQDAAVSTPTDPE
jgi:hypothetical protein